MKARATLNSLTDGGKTISEIMEGMTLGEVIMACGGRLLNGIPTLSIDTGDDNRMNARISFYPPIGVIGFEIGADKMSKETHGEILLPRIKTFTELSALVRLLTGRGLENPDMLFVGFKNMVRKFGASFDPVTGEVIRDKGSFRIEDVFKTP